MDQRRIMDQKRRRKRGRRQSRRRRKRNLMLKILSFIILIIGIVAALLLWRRYGGTKEQADLDEYYGIENENQLAVIVDNEVLEPRGRIWDGKVYVEYSVIRDYINERFYWDPNENILLYVLPNDIVSTEVGSKDYSVSKQKNSEDYVRAV